VAALAEQDRGEEDADSDDDECVGEVEGGPVAEVQEICHVAEPDPVDQVRRAPADQQSERDRQNGMARSGALALRLTKLVTDAPGGHPVTDDLAQAILFESQEKHTRMDAFLSGERS